MGFGMNLNMEMKKISHTFKQKDNWDGSACGDYCIGCGSCDHFPLRYAVKGFETKIKFIEFYCYTCYDFLKASQEENDKKYDFVVAKQNICCGCDATNIELELKSVSHVEDKIICLSCANKNPILHLSNTFMRCRNPDFKCPLCDISYSPKINGMIKCEEISKIDEYVEYQTKYNAHDGTVTNIVIKDSIPLNYELKSDGGDDFYIMATD